MPINPMLMAQALQAYRPQPGQLWPQVPPSFSPGMAPVGGMGPPPGTVGMMGGPPPGTVGTLPIPAGGGGMGPPPGTVGTLPIPAGAAPPKPLGPPPGTVGTMPVFGGGMGMGGPPPVGKPPMPPPTMGGQIRQAVGGTPMSAAPMGGMAKPRNQLSPGDQRQMLLGRVGLGAGQPMGAPRRRGGW